MAGASFVALFFFIFVGILILPTVFFLLTLQRALSKCYPTNRTMSPGLVWLQIIPVFGFIWQFFVVIAVANSLEREFAARRIPAEPKPGQTVGLAMCITRVLVIIPFLGLFSGLASIVLWIVYWVKIAGLSAKLDYAPPLQFSPPPYWGGNPDPGMTAGPYLTGGPQQPTTPPYGPSGGAAPGGQAPSGATPSGQTSSGAAAGGTPQQGGAQPTARDCATCGGSVPSSAAFCPQCGAKVG